MLARQIQGNTKRHSSGDRYRSPGTGHTLRRPCHTLSNSAVYRCIRPPEWSDRACDAQRVQFAHVFSRGAENREITAIESGSSCVDPVPDNFTNISIAALEDTDIPDISVELKLLDHLKERIRLARQIDTQQHRVKKRNHERQWLKETAEAMEIELDSDVVR